MRYGKVAVLVLGCAALAPAAYAQQSGALCNMTNMGQVSPSADAVNQQCFVQVVSKSETAGAGQLVEGNYNISLSGGGGGGGGGGADPGRAGFSAQPATTTQYLAPGMYRLTIGAGGLGGRGCSNQTPGEDGAPTSVSNAYTGQHIAGFQRAEYWARNMHYDNVNRTQVAGAGGRSSVGASSAPRATATDGARVAAGGAGGRGGHDCTAGSPGQNGYITITPAS